MNDRNLLPPALDRETRQWAMLCHYAAFFGLMVPMIGNVIGPLILWQLKREAHSFIDQQGKEALNFQITYSILMMICGVLAWFIIGFPLMALISLIAFVLVVIAGIRANEGKSYRYPFCWRLVK
ncbi:DUF4870 domain-containing protein [Azomonas macrocytogenes]|uniref:Orotate phosphoribosyltransferase n=1 Tax=Azomonas macrocytogenes TaxID=69962 RepID=A0A839T1T3_AZOMA|nr:DUF4870 domain-containing protein [Azomonas macrocytogenes]MBB3103501.1 hypothetical protein [Azomonas macrocytogenes]